MSGQARKVGDIFNVLFGVAFVACVIAVLLGLFDGKDTPDPPTPTPSDDDIPAVVSAAEADCEAFAEMVREEVRAARRKRNSCAQIRGVMPDKIRGSFPKLGEQFQFADDAAFVSTLRSAATGLVHASDTLRRMRRDDSDDAIADYYAELSPNFRAAADQFDERNVHEQRIHDELKRANTQASQRLIEALCQHLGERAFSGYLIDQEHREELRQTSNSQLNLMALAEGAPKEIDPRGWHRIEDQGQMGSCFPAGTKVTMADGSLKAIESVMFGQ